MQKQNDAAQAAAPNQAPEPLVLDIRPIFARGASPCGTIDQSVASLLPSQDFILIAPFEPLPLFTKLAAQGFEHKSEARPDGSWAIRFVRTGSPVDVPFQPASCCS